MKDQIRAKLPLRSLLFGVTCAAGIFSSKPTFAVVSVYGSLAGNSTEDVSVKTVTGSSQHVAGGIFLSKDATLGGNGLGLELTIRRLEFHETDASENFTYADSAFGFCARIVPEAGFTLALGRLTHDIKAAYEPDQNLGSKAIKDGKISGNFLSIGLAASFSMLQPYLDFTRYWLPKYGSKADEIVIGLRVHFPSGM